METNFFPSCALTHDLFKKPWLLWCLLLYLEDTAPGMQWYRLTVHTPWEFTGERVKDVSSCSKISEALSQILQSYL